MKYKFETTANDILRDEEERNKKIRQLQCEVDSLRFQYNFHFILLHEIHFLNKIYLRINTIQAESKVESLREAVRNRKEYLQSKNQLKVAKQNIE